MEKTRKFILSMALLLLVFSFAFPAAAQVYNVGGKDVTFNGFFRQEFLFGTQGNSEYNTNQTGLNGAYQMWLADANIKWSDHFETRAIFRMWGDLAYYMLQDNHHWNTFYAGSRDHLQWDTQWDQIVRELYFTYATDKFLVRAGRQQIGWGEADGLRVMDIINPLDARRMFLFYDTEGYEEVRIPKLIVKAEFYPGNFWKFYDNAVELYWNPGDIHSFGELLPSHIDTANRWQAEWGEKGFFPPGTPWPSDIGNSWGVWGPPTNAAPVNVRVFDKDRAFTLSNSEYGTRFKLNIKETFITLNYWQGFEPNTIILNGVGGGNIFGTPTGSAHLDPNLGGPALWVAKVQPRIKVAGFTLDRELFGVGPMFCQVANPVLRMEGLYSWNQTFNTNNMGIIPVATPFPMPNSPFPNHAFIPTDPFATVQRDQIRYMVGFDWAMQIPWNPKKSTFVSGQFFHIYTRGNSGPYHLLQQAPYSWSWPKNQYYMSWLMRTEYMNERVVPSILYVQDFHTRAAWIKSKIDFKIGDHWRPEIGFLWIGPNQHRTEQFTVQNISPGGGELITHPLRDNYQSFGMFADHDTAWIRIQYQF